jgi:hypothetical protein
MTETAPQNNLKNEEILDFPVFESQEELDSYIQKLEDQIIDLDQIAINLKYEYPEYERMKQDSSNAIKNADSWYKDLLEQKKELSELIESSEDWRNKLNLLKKAQLKKAIKLSQKKVDILERGLEVVEDATNETIKANKYAEQDWYYSAERKHKGLYTRSTKNNFKVSKEHKLVLQDNKDGSPEANLAIAFGAPRYELTTRSQDILKSEIKFLRSKGKE